MLVILTLEETKQFLRIDNNNEDMLISTLILSAEEYLFNATGKTFDASNNLAKLFCLVLISEWYENRELMANRIGEKVRYVITSMLIQLKNTSDYGMMP